METTVMNRRLGWTGHLVGLIAFRIQKQSMYIELVKSKRPQCKPHKRLKTLAQRQNLRMST